MSITVTFRGENEDFLREGEVIHIHSPFSMKVKTNDLSPDYYWIQWDNEVGEWREQ